MNRINFQKLEDLCLKITDGSHYSPSGVEFGVPMLSVKDMNYSGFSYSSSKYVSEKDYFDLVRADCKPLLNDVLIAKDGSYLKHVFVIKKEINQAILSSIGILRPNLKKINPDYLKYYLQTTSVKNTVSRKYVSGSALPRIILKNFGKILVIYRNVLDQQKIAITLSVLDAKIELNNKINSELEKITKTIYNYWFVQFDFPDENGKPYKSSGGKMVWSKALKKDIPYGWEVKKLNNLLKKNIDKFILNGSKHGIDTIDLSVMPSSTMCLIEKNTSDKFGSNLFKMNKFDILFGGIRPYLLKAGFAPFDGLVTGTVHSYRVIRNFDYNFTIITMVHDSVFKFAISNSKGTKMPVIASDDLLSYQLAYKEDVVKKFNQLISFKEIISKNIQENHKLAELRDFLLPMLMNGQVSIK